MRPRQEALREAQGFAAVVPGSDLSAVSHSPKELTAWQDCANGADVLLRAVLEMDRIS